MIAQDGRVLHEFAMPVFGLIPLNSIEEIWKKTKENQKAMQKIGCRLPNPFLTLQTVAFTGLPFLRLTDKGLVDIRNKRVVSLFPD